MYSDIPRYMALASPTTTLSAAEIERENAKAEHSREVRKELDRIAQETPDSLKALVDGLDSKYKWPTLRDFRRDKEKTFDADSCRFVLDGEAIRLRHTGRTLKQLLGPGLVKLVEVLSCTRGHCIQPAPEAHDTFNA